QLLLCIYYFLFFFLSLSSFLLFSFLASFLFLLSDFLSSLKLSFTSSTAASFALLAVSFSLSPNPDMLNPLFYHINLIYAISLCKIFKLLFFCCLFFHHSFFFFFLCGD